MTPRVRAMMKSEGFEVPNDRVVVFYHPRETRSVARRKQRDRARTSPSQ
jgi:hypothetical protein